MKRRNNSANASSASPWKNGRGKPLPYGITLRCRVRAPALTGTAVRRGKTRVLKKINLPAANPARRSGLALHKHLIRLASSPPSPRGEGRKVVLRRMRQDTVVLPYTQSPLPLKTENSLLPRPSSSENRKPKTIFGLALHDTTQRDGCY